MDAFANRGSDVNELALAAVATFIQSVQSVSMVQRFVLVVESVDEQDRWFSAFVAPGQKRWDSMGLLEYAMSLERNTALVADGDDDE